MMNKEKEVVSLIWVAKKKKKSLSLWFGLLKTNNSARRKRRRKKEYERRRKWRKKRRRSLFSLVYNILIFEFTLHMNNEAKERERKKNRRNKNMKEDEIRFYDLGCYILVLNLHNSRIMKWKIEKEQYRHIKWRMFNSHLFRNMIMLFLFNLCKPLLVTRYSEAK